jgi:hypothetical protein
MATADTAHLLRQAVSRLDELGHPARLAQRQLPDDHHLRHISLKRCDDDILAGYEPAIYADAREAGTRNDSAAPGELREVVTINPINGHKTIEFKGTRSFVEAFKAPVRRVLGFLSSDGQRFVNTGGRYL